MLGAVLGSGVKLQGFNPLPQKRPYEACIGQGQNTGLQTIKHLGRSNRYNFLKILLFSPVVSVHKPLGMWKPEVLSPNSGAKSGQGMSDILDRRGARPRSANPVGQTAECLAHETGRGYALQACSACT